jgi:hypothetical protein
VWSVRPVLTTQPHRPVSPTAGDSTNESEAQRFRTVFTLDLAFEAGGSFGESTEGTSTRFGVEAVGILGIAGGRMC